MRPGPAGARFSRSGVCGGRGGARLAAAGAVRAEEARASRGTVGCLLRVLAPLGKARSKSALGGAGASPGRAGGWGRRDGGGRPAGLGPSVPLGSRPAELGSGLFQPRSGVVVKTHRCVSVVAASGCGCLAAGL